MTPPPDSNPTKLELEILKILWEQSPCTARQIRERLQQQGRALAHTSVITTLQKMVDKGQLEQLDPLEGKALRFAPRVSEPQVSKRMLADLVDRVFNGSTEAVLLRLSDLEDLDENVIKRLRGALNQKLKEQKR